MDPRDEKILKDLFMEYYDQLKLHARGLLKNEDEAHVAVQETFNIALDKLNVVLNHPNQIGWLKTTVRNVCMNMLKARKRDLNLFMSLEDLTDGNLPAAEDRDESDPLEAYADILNKKDRELLWRTVLLGQSRLEAAQATGLKLWACQKRIQRAKKKIRAHVEEQQAKRL